MTSDYLKRSRSLDEIYASIERNRVEAAKVVQAKFHDDMEAAIAAIASIGSIAGARVLADSRVASANVLIEAELAATRLLAEAEMQVSKYAHEALTKPKDFVEAALQEIGRNTSVRLITSAKDAVEKIQHDAETAVNLLRETGAIAIREVQALAAQVAAQTTRDAELAAEKLAEFRKQARTPDEAMSEGVDVAKLVANAAQEASARLQEAIKTTLDKINTITEEACAAVHASALAANQKIASGRERALLRLKETLNIPY